MAEVAFGPMAAKASAAESPAGVPSMAVLLAGHPCLPFLETYALDPARDRDEYERRPRTLKVPELTYRHGRLLYALRGLGHDASVRFNSIAGEQGDWLYYDIYLSSGGCRRPWTIPSWGTRFWP